jgi:hypothetical protein
MTAERKAKLIIVLNALTLIGGAVTILLLFRLIATAAHQNTITNDRIVSSQKATENELRCLASFFSQTNRQTLRINNLESCQIIHTDTGETEILPLAPTASFKPSPALPSNTTTQNSTSIQTPKKPKKALSNTPQALSQASTQGLKTATSSVKSILGVKLCVPFLKVCIH